jgi:hypothetical protein
MTSMGDPLADLASTVKLVDDIEAVAVRLARLALAASGYPELAGIRDDAALISGELGHLRNRIEAIHARLEVST